jgi:hypothetical protein
MGRRNGGFIGRKNVPASNSAEGGIWSISDVQQYTRSGEWALQPISGVTILLTGGGGGGQTGHSPGGEGGAVEEYTGQELVPGVSYSVGIGGGGGGSPRGPSGASGGSGGQSTFSGPGISTLSASGGTGNGSRGDGGTNPAQGRQGGPGQQTTIRGTNEYFGGGGGVAGGSGYEQSPGGPGGPGGGGYGSRCCGQPGQGGTGGTGGAGGGGGIQWCGTVYCEAYGGGTGNVIVSYPGTTQIWTGGTVTQTGGRTIHYFSGTSTLVG